MIVTYLGHIVHIAGAPDVTGAREALATFPDGALIVDDSGVITYCGPRQDAPATGTVVDHRGSFLLPGFVDTHMHFPQTYSLDAYGGGQLSNGSIPASSRRGTPGRPRVRRADRPRLRRRPHPIGHHSGDGVRVGISRRPGRPVHRDRARRVATGERTRRADRRTAAAAPLMTSEERAIELCAAEIDRWHGDDSSLLQVAVVPRFTLSMSTRTLAALGELYDDVRGRGCSCTLAPQREQSAGHRRDRRRQITVLGELVPRHLRREVPARVGGRRIESAGTPHHHGARRALHRHRTGPDGRDRHLDRALSCVATVPGIGDDAVAADRRRRGERGRRYRCGRRGRMADPQVLGCAFKVHLSEPGDDAVALHPAELLFTGTLAGARALDAESRFGNFDAGRRPTSWWWTRPLGTTGTVVVNGIRAEDDEMARDQLLFALLLGMRSRPSPECMCGAQVVAPS